MAGCDILQCPMYTAFTTSCAVTGGYPFVGSLPLIGEVSQQVAGVSCELHIVM